MDCRKQTVSRETTSRVKGLVMLSSDTQNKRRLFFFLTALAAAAFSPLSALADYSYSFGGGRKQREADTGLVRPSGSYIGPGTVSQTARGIYGAGAQNNPGLPRVNLGANVATPGDNMYGGNPTQVAAPARQQGGGVYNRLPSGKMGANVGMPGDSIRSDLGRNNQLPMKQQFRWIAAPQQVQTQVGAQTQGQAQGVQAIMTPNGTATYSDAEIKQGIHF